MIIYILTLSWLSTIANLAPLRISRITQSTLFRYAQWCNGVHPLPSAILGSAPFCNNKSHKNTWPSVTAKCKALKSRCCGSFQFKSAPWTIVLNVFSKSPSNTASWRNISSVFPSFNSIGEQYFLSIYFWIIQFCFSSLDESGFGLSISSVKSSSKTFFANLFPVAINNFCNSKSQASNVIDLTLDTWVPNCLWIPEHEIHIKIPRFILAQVGSKMKKKKNN